MFKTQIKVRYSETDQMGIVHHSRYFPWFEVGRTDFFAVHGISYGELEASGIWFPLTDCYCSFKESAKYEDEIDIIVELSEFSGVRCKFNYEIQLSKTGKLIASGYTSHAFTTPELKPINLKKHRIDLYEKLYVINSQ